MKWFRLTAGALMVIGCGSSTVAFTPVGAGGAGASGQGGGNGGGDGIGGAGTGGGDGTCGGTVCGPGESCFQSCDVPKERYCSQGNITCGEHDMGACGCDGKAYATLCDLNNAGVDQGVAGSCEPPAGRFACAGLLCRTADQICVLVADDPYCHQLDSPCAECACTTVSDFCFRGNGTCEDVAGGGVSVTCG